jgi:uncharacterized membrane protein YozB (DUF420 family)
MTLSDERVGTAASLTDEDLLAPAPTSSPTKSWWARSWVIPLWAVVLFYLYYQITPFIGVPPSEIQVSPHPGFSAYYPILIVHMTAGTIAMLTACMQVWQWLRRSHPKIHRASGRLYVFAGAVPGALAGMTIIWFAPASGKLGVMISVLGWVTTALVAYFAARRGNYVLHRRFMLYSFAFVMNNIWGVFFQIIWIKFHLTLDFTYLLEASRWLGWVINLALVQWWLYRTIDRPVE